jgi:hypothetical protein
MRRERSAAAAANRGSVRSACSAIPDPLGWRVRGESDPGIELLDAGGVERLVASERQQQLRHAMGEGAEHRSQSAMPDHRRRAGHEAIVVGIGDHLDVDGDPNGVAIDGRAEREDSVQLETGNCLTDAVDQRRLTVHHGRAKGQQYPRALDVRTTRALRTDSDAERPGMQHV